MVPIFKGEDPTDFANYRPVSVLPVLSQLFERVLRARLVGFLDRQRVIIPGQYGFRAGHSTTNLGDVILCCRWKIITVVGIKVAYDVLNTVEKVLVHSCLV